MLENARQPRAPEDRDPVLELDTVTDDDADVDVNALPQNAFRPNAGAVSHLHLVPDLGGVADRCGHRYIRRAVNS